MRILMLGWELPPHNSGGLGVACYQLCKHLAVEGSEIDFVVPYQGGHEDVDFMHVIGATDHGPADLQYAAGAYDSGAWDDPDTTSRPGGPGGLRWQQARYVEFVRQLVQQNDYDAIHAHDWLTLEAGMAARKHLNRPLIAHVHATEFDRAGGTNGNPLVHEIELQGLMMADRIVAVSGATKQLIIDRYQIPGDKIEVVYNSIDTSEYGPVDDADSYAYLNHMKAQGYQVVVSISRLTIMKGLRFYLEAAQLALQANPKLIFVVAGNGELYHELIEISAELSIAEQVVFTGFVRGKPWRDLYAVADMFVMPSVSEPFGLTALEAVGYGSAALVSKQSGVGEILNHVLKFDFWDTHRLASQIVALSYQPSLAQELRDNSWREFSQLSWQQAARHCQRLYQQVAGATS